MARTDTDPILFTSYAQNFEDVLLWRALKGVQDGFYIDVGAQDPRLHSVSRGFYEAGWRGISVEPVLSYCSRLRADRPGETILQTAVGTSSADIAFFEFRGTGLSTGNRAIAERHVAQGFPQTVTKVPVMPLSAVLQAAGGREVHWLKIDVEGMEDDVIASWGDSDVRPWIVVIESTLPMTQTQTYAGWEPQLLARGYQFVHFDGLNRYYCVEARPDLAAHFGPGPNIFDAFQVSSEAGAPGVKVLGDTIEAGKAEIARLEAAVGAFTQELASLRTAHHALKARSEMPYPAPNPAPTPSPEIEALKLERDSLLADRVVLDSIRSSTSWKITAPLRAVSRIVHGEGRGVARHGIVMVKRTLKSALARVISYLNARPRLKQYVLGGLDKVPPLRDRLRRAMSAGQGVDGALDAPGWSLAAEPHRVEAWRDVAAERKDTSAR